jgi:ADP-ribose pyrophosphatase YjhB (NUDIX family)
MAELSRSGGGVVVGADGKILVVSQNGDSWSLPKGRLELGEDALQAALREIKEESGITQLELVRPLGKYRRFIIAKGGQGEDESVEKEIELFLFTTNETDLKPQDSDNPEAKWANPADVARILTHPKDQEFFANILPTLADLIA